MNHAGCMGGLHSLTGIDQRLGRLLDGKSPAATHPVRHAAAGDIFQDQACRRFFPADFVDRHDIGVIDPARRLGLGQQTRQRDRVARQILGEDLDGNVPLNERITRLQDDAHRPLAEHGRHLVSPDGAANPCLVVAARVCARRGFIAVRNALGERWRRRLWHARDPNVFFRFHDDPT